MTHHIVLADNQAIFRAGAARVLANEDDIRIVAQCDDPERLLQIAANMHGCSLLVARMMAPNFEHLHAVARAASNRLILLIDRGDDISPEHLNMVDGLISRHTKSTALVECVRRVGRGERCIGKGAIGSSNMMPDGVGVRVSERLTQRELQIIGHIVRGRKNREIAELMGTKEQVVKNYLRSIYDKTGVSDRLELALYTLHHKALADAAAKAIANGSSRNAPQVSTEMQFQSA